MTWQTRPVGSLKHVGPAMQQKLARLGITTARDLIYHFPRRYDDFSKIVPIRLMRPGNVTFKGEIERVAGRYARARKLHLTEAIISDGTGTVKAIWFNQSYLAKTIPTGTPVLISGELKFKNNDLALQSPAIEVVEPGRITKDTARIVPVYPETEGLSSKQLRGLIQPLLPLVADTPETLPEHVATEHKLMPLGKALSEIHFPSSQTMLAKARLRLSFEELWYLMLTSLIIKHEIATEDAPLIPFDVQTAKSFIEALSFELTPQQKRAAWEIFQDLAKPHPMNRLLEGDVGSGKTVVAAMSAAMTMKAGFQATLMVPTEILARQHYAAITPLLEKLGYETALVIGKQKSKDRAEALSKIESTKSLLIIGTHALLSQDIAYPNLGLAIIDEQHRFGVAQRLTLKGKSSSLPHLLSMTATPIPRTLQLTVYGDLDISVIDALPPGRQPITTKVLQGAKRDDAYDFANAQIEAGRQVFVICPLVDMSEKVDAKSVTQEFERLKAGPFKKRNMGLVHGRLSSDEKQSVMDDFASGKLDILVATTVIEVGIDIPNAAVMIVEDAERFGLATLHQLRGRIGRGRFRSHCFLLSGSRSAQAADRLKALEKTQDGFRLAQIDLELRGPGQIYGRQQHGDLDVQLTDLADTKFLALVRTSAIKFLSDPGAMLKYPQVTARVNALKAVTSLD